MVGVDAGGSATRVVVCGGRTCEPSGARASMNALLTKDIPAQLAAIAREERADRIGVGMPGVRAAGTAAELSAATEALSGIPVVVVEDVEAARAGAFLGGPGIVVAAGTGTVALGSDGTGLSRAGGHGFLLGDEGGAYWIGRQAVACALRHADRYGDCSPLGDAIMRQTGGDLASLVARVHRAPADRSLLASLAPLITAAAETDADARRITDAAADHLVELARIVAARVGDVPVAGIGGVFESARIWDRFSTRCAAARPLAQPSVGAALIAARRLT